MADVQNIYKTTTDALNWRYAVKEFDKTKPLSPELLHEILESGRLAPSSIGIEAWKFIVVENPELRAKLREAAYGQPKVTDAPALIVLTRRTDVRENITREALERTAKAQNVSIESLEGLKGMLEGGIGAKDDAELDAWARSQAYIPLGTMIAAASLLGVDSGPMEGFDPAKVNEILGLPARNLKVTAMLALGYRGEDPAATRAKVRRDFADVVEFVK